MRDHDRRRQSLTLEEARQIRDPRERQFAVNAILSGLTVERGRVIEVEKPVRDRRGIRQKTKTQPDFFVADDENASHVEVTNGRGTGRHKRAQRRVVEAARERNYVVITGRAVQWLDELPEDTKPTFLKRLLKWL